MFDLFAARSTLTLDDAKRVLGVPPGGYMSPDDLKAIYRQKAQAAHPDKGGTIKQIQDVNEAYDILRGKAKPAMAPSYDYRPPPPPPPPTPKRAGPITPVQLGEIVAYARHFAMNALEWRKLGLHRIVPFETNASAFSHLTDAEGYAILRILRQWREDAPNEPLATPAQIDETLKLLRSYEQYINVNPSTWDDLGLYRIIPYPNRGEMDIRRWTEDQAEKVLRILRPAVTWAEKSKQHQQPPPPPKAKQPPATKKQIDQIIRLKLTHDEWYAFGLNRISRFPGELADYYDLTEDDAKEILAIVKQARKPATKKRAPRSSPSSEPTSRARERMYEAYDRADGDHEFKFTKMLVALRKRIKATTDPAKRAGIVDMLREELNNHRWSIADKVVFRHILDVELRA